MLVSRNISAQEALDIGNALNVNWNTIDLSQFRRGLEVELEHGLINKNSNVTGDDMLLTGKIALAHLTELDDYYSRLDTIENIKVNVSKSSILGEQQNSKIATFAGAAVGVGLVLFINYLKKKKSKI